MFLSSLIWFFSLSFISVSLEASLLGNDVGNGGNVVVCYDDKKSFESIELLDFFEARKLRNFSYEKNQEKALQIIKNLSHKLKELDPKRSEYIQSFSSYFLKNMQMIEGAGLKKIDDSHHLIDPLSRCQVSQIVIMRKGALSREREFLVDKRLWHKLDELNKAGLIIHEIIYRYLSLAGEKNSNNSRFYTSMILSEQFKNINQKEYWRILREKRIPFYR